MELMLIFGNHARGGTSRGSARISARAGRVRAGSARSSSKISGENSARLARARKFSMRFWLSSLELDNLSGLARLVFRAKKRAKIKPQFGSFWLVFGSFLKINFKQILSVILYNLYWNWHIEVNELNLKSCWAYLKLKLSSLSLSLYQAWVWAQRSSIFS